MVAKNIRLPNIRRMFVPDTGYTIVDADLSGADAQVVAWEAGDEDLKTAFRKGIKIHAYNARIMWPEEHKNMTDDEIKEHSPYYKSVKVGVHATNYGASPNALVANIGWSKSFAEEFQERWFYLHPKIKAWHDRLQRHLDGLECWNCYNQDITLNRPCSVCGSHLGRTVKNKFGYRRIYFDRIEGNILPEALAWIPQSTVAFCTELGWTNIAYGNKYLAQLGHAKRLETTWYQYFRTPDAFDKWNHIVTFLIQVHDSIVFEVRHEHEDYIPDIVKDMEVIVPYDDPLIIPMGFSFSRKSWGDCR